MLLTTGVREIWLCGQDEDSQTQFKNNCLHVDQELAGSEEAGFSSMYIGLWPLSQLILPSSRPLYSTYISEPGSQSHK